MGNVCVEKGFSSSFPFFCFVLFFFCFFTLLDFYRLFYFKHAGHRHWCIYICTPRSNLLSLWGWNGWFFFLHSHPHIQKKEKVFHVCCSSTYYTHGKTFSDPFLFFFPSFFFFFRAPGIFLLSPSQESERKKQTRWKYYYYNSLICWNAACGIAAGPTGPATFVFFSFFYGWLSSPYIFFWGLA